MSAESKYVKAAAAAHGGAPFCTSAYMVMQEPHLAGAEHLRLLYVYVSII